jgi:DNA mismatch endonuclease (patch repair protein)
MADVFSKKKRSWIMSRIRSENTSIDRRMRDMLSEARLKFVMYPDLYGKPDFQVGKRILVFCDGDFWHGYRYAEKKRPAKKYWREKIERNMKRDRHVSRRLRTDGWSVLRIWEHDIKRKPETCKRKIMRKVAERKHLR